MASAAGSRQKCFNEPDKFCHACGMFTPLNRRSGIALLVKDAYEAYFGIPLAVDTEK